MKRVQKFVVTIEMPYKDGCGEIVTAYNAGDIRSALTKGLPNYDSISVDNRTDMEEVKGDER